MESPTGGIIQISKEVQGDYECMDDLLFFKIGASIHLKPSDSAFDLNNTPQRPIAVSERFGLLFLAHSEGFLVAKTKDVIGLAKEVKGTLDAEKENGVKVKPRRPSIQESCILDVRIGNVSILAVGHDSSILAATVGGEIRVYSVNSLAKKDQKPLLSYFLGESVKDVKDFQWRKNSNKAFTLLSMDVSTAASDLYAGSIDGQVHKVMDNIDTFDWSSDGKFIAVAWKQNLNILSGKFENLHSLPLPLQAGLELDHQIKVDCIRWIHSDTIVIGCTQLDTDGNEDGYLVQVVNNKGSEFKASSEPTLVSFNDIFHDICDDLLHSGGPHLLASYLDRWGIALVANRKSRNDHVVLLQLPPHGGKEETVILEFDREKFTPRIELQENGDDNLILGLDVDKTSLFEKLEYIDGDDVKELSPYCIVFCLSSEGKLVMFHITRISDPFLPSIEISEVISDGIISAEHSSLVCNLEQNRGSSEDSGKKVQSCGVLGTEKLDRLVIPELQSSEQDAESLLQISQSHSKKFQELITPQITYNHLGDKVAVNTMKSNYQTIHHDDTSTASSLSIKPTSSLDIRKPTTDLLTKQKVAYSSYLHEGDSYGSVSTGNSFVSGKTSANVPSFVSSASIIDSQGKAGIQTVHSSRQSSVANFPAGSKIFTSKESDIFVMSKQPVIVPHANTSTFSRKNSVQSELIGTGRQTMVDNRQRSQEGSKMPDSGRELSGHFYSVNDMVGELDRLLLAIEQESGFADNSTDCLKNLVFRLEKGLEKLLKKSRMCKDAVAELDVDVQHLQDKMVRILAWEGYMEGVMKQASNAEYWDIWNRQKLGPDFELKQQQILKGDQNLRNHILELERHFNVIELNKFGENGASRDCRALHTSESSRQVQMLHRLHTTVKSQLTAAEHLSECLSAQMATLNITSPSVKRHSMAKELLNSIGVDHHHADSFESPNVKKTGFLPESSKKNLLSSLPNTDKGYTTRNISGTHRSFEPETARRRRDSLNSTWNSFKPQKTTVKRMSNRKQFGVSDINSYHTNKEDSPTAIAPSQKNLASSSFQSTRDESQDYAYSTVRDRKEKLYQMHEPQASSVFKCIRDLSESSEVVVDSSFLKSPPSTVAHTSFLHPSSLETVSPPTTDENIQKTFGDSYPSQTSKFKEVSERVPAFSSRKLILDPKITYSSQSKLSTISGFPSNDTNIIFQTKNPPFQNIKVFEQTRKPVNMQEEENILSSATVSVRKGKGPLSTSVDVSNDLQADNVKRSCTFESPIISQVSTSASQISAVLPSTLSVEPILSSPSTAESLPLGPLLTSKTAETSLLPSTEAESSLILSPPPAFSNSSTSVPSPAFKESLNISKAQNTMVLPVSAVVSSSQSTLLFSNVPSSLPSQSHSGSGTTSLSAFSPASGSLFEASSVMSHGVSNVRKENDDNPFFANTQEDEMDEEASETPVTLNMGNHSLFGLGSSNTSSTQKSNPFGGSYVSPVAISSSSPLSFTVPTGEIFKPASFGFPSIQPAQSSSGMNINGSSGGLSGFGQSSQVGSGQHALGSVLGSFGQSRQLGGVQESRQFGFAPTSGSGGGFVGAASGGGFASAPSGGGFAGAASGGGFAGVSTGGGFGRGFTSAASSAGFGGAATGGSFGGGANGSSGFSALPSGGGGFGAVAGFGSSFGGFGSNSGAGKPPPNLLMQMRK